MGTAAAPVRSIRQQWNMESHGGSLRSVSPAATDERQPTVLIVDDDPTILTVFRGFLEEAGYRVLTAEDGPEATQILRSGGERIDLIILDWILPSMSGVQWLEHILLRNDPKARVILCTGQHVSDTLYKVAGAKVTGFLKKPFQWTELLAAVERALGGKPQQEAGGLVASPETPAGISGADETDRAACPPHRANP